MLKVIARAQYHEMVTMKVIRERKSGMANEYWMTSKH